MGQSAKRIGKADPLDRNFLALGGFVHHGTDQVVNQREHRQFLEKYPSILALSVSP